MEVTTGWAGWSPSWRTLKENYWSIQNITLIAGYDQNHFCLKIMSFWRNRGPSKDMYLGGTVFLFTLLHLSFPSGRICYWMAQRVLTGCLELRPMRDALQRCSFGGLFQTLPVLTTVIVLRPIKIISRRTVAAVERNSFSLCMRHAGSSTSTPIIRRFIVCCVLWAPARRLMQSIFVSDIDWSAVFNKNKKWVSEEVTHLREPVFFPFSSAVYRGQKEQTKNNDYILNRAWRQDYWYWELCESAWMMSFVNKGDKLLSRFVWMRAVRIVEQCGICNKGLFKICLHRTGFKTRMCVASRMFRWCFDRQRANTLKSESS